MRAACQPPKPPSQAAQLEDTMLHQLGVLELLVQQSALLLRLTAHVAAAAAAAPVQQQVMAWPRQDSNSSQPADTACLADDAASECRCSSRSKRAHPAAGSDDCEALSPPSWRRACLGSGTQPVLPLPQPPLQTSSTPWCNYIKLIHMVHHNMMNPLNSSLLSGSAIRSTFAHQMLSEIKRCGIESDMQSRASIVLVHLARSLCDDICRE